MSIIIYDERKLPISVSDNIVLIHKRTHVKVTYVERSENVKIESNVPPPIHGKVASIEQVSEGFSHIGPTIRVTLDNGVVFELDGENGSHEYAWYKLP